MQSGLIISGALHTAVILFAVVVLPSAFDPADVPTVIPVELLAISEETNIRQKRKIDEPDLELEAGRPEPKPEKLKTIQIPVPEPEPQQELEVAERVPASKPQNAEPEPETESDMSDADPKSLTNVRPLMKPNRSNKDGFNLDQIAALLNKIPEEKKPPHVLKEVPEQESSEEEVPTVGAGLQLELTLSEIDAFKVQMRRCWSVPAGAAYSEDLIVTIRVFLNIDGTLSHSPELIAHSRYSLATHAHYRAAAESAVRAIQRCQPFRMPPDKYINWRQLELTFDPRDMLGR